MKILFVYQALSTFVKRDLDILRSVHTVREVHFQGINNIPKLWSGVKWCDVSFSWFGKLHAFFTVLLSKTLGKKSVVISGGDDVANAIVEGKSYGLCSQWHKRWCPIFVFKNADLILAVSKSNLKETILNAKGDPKKTKLLYHGFDTENISFRGNPKKEELVVTVSEIIEENIRVKGLRLFVESGALLPHVLFYLVGPWKDNSIRHLKKTSNIKFLGGKYGEDLIKFYQQAKVYVQASAQESFGCAVAEAMLCECIPVVSRVGALPEVVGDCGFYVDKLEPKELAEKIQLALQNPQIGKMARERIIKNFPLERRKEELLKAVSLLSDQKYRNENIG